MAKQQTFSRRTFLTAAAIAIPVAGVAIAVPSALTRRPDIALWWSTPEQNGDTARATLNLHIPASLAGADDPQLFLDATGSAVYTLTGVSTTDPWKTFFAVGGPFQLLTARAGSAGAGSGSGSDRTATVVVDLTRLDAGSTPGSVRASCTGGDGTLLAEATLDLTRPFFTRFS